MAYSKSTKAAKRGDPKLPFYQSQLIHLQRNNFFFTKFCGKQETYQAPQTKVIVINTTQFLCLSGVGGSVDRSNGISSNEGVLSRQGGSFWDNEDE